MTTIITFITDMPQQSLDCGRLDPSSYLRISLRLRISLHLLLKLGVTDEDGFPFLLPEYEYEYSKDENETILMEISIPHDLGLPRLVLCLQLNSNTSFGGICGSGARASRLFEWTAF